MNLQKQLDTANHRAIALALPEGATLVEFVLSQKPGNYRPYAHPKYWGAFICQGDATPL